MDEEFAHDGDDCEFFGFGTEKEGLVEGHEDGVVSGGDEGGHVEGASGFGTSGGGATLTAEEATVAVEGGEAGEGGTGTTVEGAEFGHVGEQGGGGEEADGFDGAKGAHFRGDGRVQGDGFLEEGFEVGQVGVELLKKGAALFDEVFVAQETKTVGFGQTQGDEVVAAGTEIGQADLGGIGGRRGGGLEGAGVSAEDAGVDLIGLSELTASSGEVPDVAGIKVADGHASRPEGVEQGAFITTGGFAYEVQGAPLDGSDQAFETCGTIRELGGTAPVDLEGVFSDVEADVLDNWGVHGLRSLPCVTNSDAP